MITRGKLVLFIAALSAMLYLGSRHDAHKNEEVVKRITPPRHTEKNVKIDVSEEMKLFDSSSIKEQRDLVLNLQGNQHLGPNRTKFALEILHAKNLDANVRNIAANALLAQRPPIANLDNLFFERLIDVSEDVSVRENSIQHFALSFSESQDKDFVIRTLKDLANSKEGAFAGTSLINLHRLEKKYKLSLDIDEIVRIILNDPKMSLSNRITALAIIGERKQFSERDHVRKIVIESKDLRRVAIGCLSLIGDGRDIELLERYEYSDDRLVAMSAKSALSLVRDRK